MRSIIAYSIIAFLLLIIIQYVLTESAAVLGENQINNCVTCTMKTSR
jgi:hypothetical protein